MQHPPLVRSLFGLSAGLLLLACGPGDRPSDDGNDTDDIALPDAADAIDATPEIDAMFVDESKVYAHGSGNLYRVDTTTFEPVLVAPITGLLGGSLTDLAIDKDDNAVGITLSDLYSVDLATGVATLLRENVGDNNGNGFTSLSFVPTDLNDSNSPEILVAANVEGNVFQIDPATGDSTLRGNYGGDGATLIRSSGDIVAIRGVGIFATVTIGDDLTAPDYFAQIDPATWAATPIGNVGTGYDRIFGLAYWGGKFFGFVDNGVDAATGTLIEIDLASGTSAVRDTGDVRWYGAGVATDAPIID